MDSIIRQTWIALENRHRCSRRALQIGIICVFRVGVRIAWNWWLLSQLFIYFIALSIQEWDSIQASPASSLPQKKQDKKTKQSPYAYFCLWPKWWQAWFLLAPCQCIARGCPRVSEAAYPLATCVDCSLEMHRHWCLLSFLPRHPRATYPHKHRHLKPTIWPRLEDHPVAAFNDLPLSSLPVTHPHPSMPSAQVAFP